jgi:hypothetical protein
VAESGIGVRARVLDMLARKCAAIAEAALVYKRFAVSDCSARGGQR